MPPEVFVIDFSGKNVSLDSLIFHTISITEEDIIDIFSDIEIVVGNIQHFSTGTNKILYYIIAENGKKSLMGLLLGLEEDQGLFEVPLLEEAELLLRKDRDENFLFEIKESNKAIIQKAIKRIEERMAALDKEREENNTSVKNLEEELKNFYDKEKELLAELEKGAETNSIMEKIESVINRQKQLEERIKTQKNLKVQEDQSFNLKNQIINLQKLYNHFDEFTFIQSSLMPEKMVQEEVEETEPEKMVQEEVEETEPEKMVQEEVEETELEPVIEPISDSEILDLKRKLENLSAKQSASQDGLVSTENSMTLESEITTTYNETIEPFTESSNSEKSVLEPEVEKSTISGILTEKVGRVKAAIIEYLFWLKKPRTIAEISQDLETSAEEIREQVEDMVKNGYICQLTKKNIKEIFVTVCPNCPLQHKCEKERGIDWNQILSRVRNV